MNGVLDHRSSAGGNQYEGGSTMIDWLRDVVKRVIGPVTFRYQLPAYIPVISRVTEDLMKKEVIRQR